MPAYRWASLRDWRSTMVANVLPELGSMQVGAVATSDVKRVLRPLTLAGKHATARMVAGRIVAVLENLREPAGSGRVIVEAVMRSLPKAAAVPPSGAARFPQKVLKSSPTSIILSGSLLNVPKTAKKP